MEEPGDTEEQTLRATKGLPWHTQAWSALLLVALHAEKRQGSCMLSTCLQTYPSAVCAVSLPSALPLGKALVTMLLRSLQSVNFAFLSPVSQQYLHPERTAGMSFRQLPHLEGALQLLLAQAELIAVHGTQWGNPTKTSAPRSRHTYILSTVRTHSFR